MMINSWRRGCLAIGGAAAVVLSIPAPASAQVDARLERIETELRALQRKVFPGGDDRFFEPEITPQSNASQAQPGVSGSTLTGVLSRLDAMETQLARLTAATEVNENALKAVEIRLAALEGGRTVPPLSSSTGSPSSASAPTGAIQVPGENTSTGFIMAEEATAPAGPSSSRLAGVQAIAKPASGDEGDDEYVYGFRLWEAGYFPEAQQQLALFVERYPNHWRTTYGRNLLGRAFLDAGEPRRAATHFFDNFQADKQAARAPDSLLYLASSMIELGDTRRACIALAEFGDTYPALAVGRLQTMYDSLGGRVTCNG